MCPVYNVYIISTHLELLSLSEELLEEVERAGALGAFDDLGKVGVEGRPAPDGVGSPGGGGRTGHQDGQAIFIEQVK